MTFPIEISYGVFRMSFHLIFEMLGFFFAFRYYLFLRKKGSDIISTTNRIWIIIGAAFGALIFSRLIGGLEHPSVLSHNINLFKHFYLNKTIVGALLGGLLGVELIKKKIGVTHSSGDLFVFPIMLGIMIGRIGCFTAGVFEETYGIETTSVFGMDLGDGLIRHPVSLYEIVFLLLLWLILKYCKNKLSLKGGFLFQFFLIAYLLFRFLLDFIKPGERYFFGLGSIQLSCILGLLYYYKTIFYLLFKPTKLQSYA